MPPPWDGRSVTKNYLFAGSHDAARRAAAIYSLLRTCAQHGVPPLPYLTDVLRKLAGHWPKHRLEELLPDRWQLLYGGGGSVGYEAQQTPMSLAPLTL